MQLIDTHAHLDEEAFGTDLDEALDRAAAAGVTSVLTIGTTAASSRRAVDLANRYSQVFAVVGIQPNYTQEATEDDWKVIEELSGDPRVVAVGETGLDRYWDNSPIEVQRDFFARHMELSKSRGLPFSVHCREAEADVLEFLRPYAEQGPLSGVMHSFCGSDETAAACLSMGMHLSYSGMVTYKKNDALRATATNTPLDRVLVETDSPYLAPVPNRGKRNEPSFVKFTAACLADARGCDREDFSRQTSANAAKLFGL